MAELVKEIPPFCDRVSSPSTPLPLLTAQTDLLYAIASPPSLIAQEPLPSSTSAPPLSSENRARSSRRSTPLPSGKTISSTLRSTLRSTPLPESGSGELHFPGDLGPTIPKPFGRVSQPRRVGYNLVDKLGWEAEEYEALKVGSYSPLSKALPSKFFAELRPCIE
jgi:hypothetical protein